MQVFVVKACIIFLTMESIPDNIVHVMWKVWSLSEQAVHPLPLFGPQLSSLSSRQITLRIQVVT